MDPRYHWPPQGYADPNANAQYYPQQGAPPQQQMYMQMPGSYPAQQSSGYGMPASMQYSSPMPSQQQYTPQHQHHQYPQPYSYPPTQSVQPQVQKQPLQQQYPQPRVMIPPPQTLAQTLAQQQYTAPRPQPQPQIQPRQSQPQVVIPQQRSNSSYNSSPLAGMQNPRIRQVQVQVPAHSQGQRRDNEVGGGQARAPQVQRSNSGAGIRGGGGQEAQARTQQTQPSQAAPKPVQRTPSFQQDAMRAQAPPLRAPSADSKPNTVRIQQQQQQQHSTPQHQRSAHPPSSAPQHRSSTLPQTPSSQQKMAHPKVVIKHPTPQSAPGQTRPPPPSPKALPTDLAVLLLQAADEYIDAARSIGTVTALIKNQKELTQYYKLMATALGCMESVLKNFTHPPREQASLMLRYASLLVEETDNNEEIESVLSKGIALCARSRLLDIKYSMQHLEARYQFKTNHRAALKSLDGHISDAEAFQHIVWVYAFRFLKVSLGLRVRGRPETASALQQLHEISKQADKRGDRAISITASALEAMVHLRAGGPDHLEHAQRAIAAARTYQLQETSKELGQIGALIDAVDVACSLQKGQPDWQKMNALQQKADKQPGPDDRVFSVLIEKSFGGQNLTQCTGGVFKKANDGRDELVLTWLPKNSLNMLAYHLSGLACSVTEVSRGRAYLKEGQRITQDALQRPLPCPMSLPASIGQLEWIRILDWHLAFSLGIMACRAEDFTQATQALDHLRKRIGRSPFKDDESYTLYTSYLSAVLAQCTGSLNQAAATYSLFSLPNPGTPQDMKTTLSILATLNHLLLLRSNPDPQWLTDPLTAQLEPLLNTHPNVQLETAFRLLLALTKNTDSISVNRQKTLLSNASTKAQQLHNYQLITICLCYVSERFFSEAVGEQAVKSVRAARNVARKEGRGVLWRAVACGLCERVFDRNGLVEDAAEVRKVWMEEVAGGLPDTMKAMLRGDGNGQAMLEGGAREVVMVD